MKFAGGVLLWSEGEFWNAGFAYFRAAWEGWAIAHGGKKASARPPSRDEYEAAKAALAAADRRAAKASGRDEA